MWEVRATGSKHCSKRRSKVYHSPLYEMYSAYSSRCARCQRNRWGLSSRVFSYPLHHHPHICCCVPLSGYRFAPFSFHHLRSLPIVRQSIQTDSHPRSACASTSAGPKRVRECSASRYRAGRHSCKRRCLTLLLILRRSGWSCSPDGSEWKSSHRRQRPLSPAFSSSWQAARWARTCWGRGRA